MSNPFFMNRLMFGQDMPYQMPISSPIPSMYEQGLLQRQNPQPQPGDQSQTGLGIGQSAMLAAGPIAASLLSRPRRDVNYASPTVTGGGRSTFQPGSPYTGQTPQLQSLLVRYLLGR